MERPHETAREPEDLPDGYYGKNYGRVPIGAKLGAEPTYPEILEMDPGLTPLAPVAPGNHEPRPRRVPYENYWDPEIAKLEDEHIWRKRWLFAAREEDVPDVGDRTVFNVRDLSLLIVRSGPDDFKAFYNSCRHRGRKLCMDRGSGDHIRCPFHAWTFNLDGSVEWIPMEQDFPVKDRRGMALSEVRLERWGGNIFINCDPKATPLVNALGPLVEFFQDFPLENRYTALHFRQKIRANWKVVQEAFQEGYHTTETHWDSLAVFGETATTYDCWDGEDYHISRLSTPTGVPSGYWYDRISYRETLEQYVKLVNNREAEPGRGETLTDARNYIAELKHEQIKEMYDAEVAEPTNAMLLDFVKFFMFPNFHPWWGEQFPVFYRFTPLGLNPEESLFELRLLAPLPRSGERPRPAKPVDADFDQDLRDFPELGFAGYIANQDTENMVPVQEGMRAAHPERAAPILALYVEKQITHFYETYDRVLGRGVSQQKRRSFD
jgi:phenylpropionate dioxygenase-like ring-hydroxylating dioxygenase large terminal subunit